MSLLTYAFMRWALGAGVVSALACGLIGPFVRVRRLAFLAGAVAHSALGGLGVAYYYGFAPEAGALPAAVVSAFLIGWLDKRGRSSGHGHEDALIGAIWAVGMAVGILFISRTPGYNVQLMSYLFGSILTAGPDRLMFMTGGLIVVALPLIIFWRPLVAASLDPEFARLRGLPVDGLNYLLLTLIAIAVVLLIQVVGLILVLALLTLPSASAAHWARGMVAMVGLASLIALASIFVGLEAAVSLDWPAGPVIVLAAASLFSLSSILRHIVPAKLVKTGKTDSAKSRHQA
ncbi:metal ABC transporter permease [Pelagicoccus albus]|uniref:Metal ABC transporter permease n=1 Tax=Pelagicoccus albus TaxID=415222 RepID=A0A7X1BB77_9BACT|nr:metal ABC transporter permease [Pelagicoccus albus]MBC2607828.1 metal ABC transporter permease [Pelagicoccus albus]